MRTLLRDLLVVTPVALHREIYESSSLQQPLRRLRLLDPSLPGSFFFGPVARRKSNERYSVAGALRNALGHGEMLDMGYNSPIAGQEGHTVSAKLFLPRLLRGPVSATLEAMMDTVS